ncbi:hypothetical protein EW146_g1850 [Bondarzewia mesenterica]|uniref:Uncharacterized protein n=1 Tax=Bondarzewia mesenterica TaxID=1095465 RepID=A0A4S4M312_9AGAM|nr:hypothetical protein EW146_g1850 [Bondarzewia mesenterica]
MLLVQRATSALARTQPSDTVKPSKPRHPKKKKKHVPLMCCGYALDDDFFIRYCTKHNIGSLDDPAWHLNARSAAILRIARESGLLLWHRVKTVYHNGDTDPCFTLATNHNMESMRMPREVAIQRLMAELETDERPQWYRRA